MDKVHFFETMMMFLLLIGVITGLFFFVFLPVDENKRHNFSTCRNLGEGWDWQFPEQETIDGVNYVKCERYNAMEETIEEKWIEVN